MSAGWASTGASTSTHASDYFEQLYEWALHLIRDGNAYVDDLSADEIREHRGTLTEPGRDSPWRDRPVDENLDLFARMRAGEFPDGARVLRAKIDMASPNINLRDPVLYRIVHAAHPRTGDAWCIYPTYDFAHGQSDAIEGVTHSLCTLEFEAHRPLYDWLIDHLPVPSRPRQIEFARLNLTHTVLSKRFLLRLVDRGPRSRLGRPAHADDLRPAPARLPGRGHPRLRDDVGVAKADSVIEFGHARVRGARPCSTGRRRGASPCSTRSRSSSRTTPRARSRRWRSPTTRRTPSAGTRKVPFSRELWIERDDFMEEPAAQVLPARAGPRGAPAVGVLHHLPRGREGRGGQRRRAALHLRPGDARRRRRPTAAGRRRRCTGSRRRHAIPAEVRLYDHLFCATRPRARRPRPVRRPEPELRDGPHGLPVEPSLAEVPVGETVQFERLGYFAPDPDSTPGHRSSTGR